MDRGFVTIPIAIIIILGTALLAGGSFGVYKYSEVVREKEVVQQELDKQQERELGQLEQKTEVMSTSTVTSTDSSLPTVDEHNEDALEDITQREIVRTVIEYVPVPTSSPVLEKPVVVESESQSLKVINVTESLDEDKNLIHVTWETSIDSDSRLILDDDEVFSSDNKDSKSHEVTIGSLETSKKYNYEIIAEIGNNSDSHFGKFQAPREFEVSFKDSENEDCTIVTVKDTAGYPLENTLLILGGSYGTSINIMGDTVREYTNYKGEIEYCDTIERFWVENPETKDTYYDSR